MRIFLLKLNLNWSLRFIVIEPNFWLFSLYGFLCVPLLDFYVVPFCLLIHKISLLMIFMWVSILYFVTNIPIINLWFSLTKYFVFGSHELVIWWFSMAILWDIWFVDFWLPIHIINLPHFIVGFVFYGVCYLLSIVTPTADDNGSFHVAVNFIFVFSTMFFYGWLLDFFSIVTIWFDILECLYIAPIMWVICIIWC